MINEIKIAVIGLGYVGLPLAVALSRNFLVTGFDINKKRVQELCKGIDHTLEVPQQDLLGAKALSFTSDTADLSDSNVYIVTVPTPIDENKQPDFEPLLKASEMLGKLITRGNFVIYESTVYPGATEEICVPVLEEMSGFRLNAEFYVGYSPERINPGDKQHKLTDIVKVTSGSTEDAASFIDGIYGSVITAGTYKASSIKVAEAAKVIENTQRDINIALMNDLAVIFNKLGIDTLDVLEAAGTKWNFLDFRPGLVGGHCIGVDPYYLTHKAQSVGHHPEMILAGRRFNDEMGTYVATQLIKKMVKERIQVAGANVLVMGLTFKENCPDLRNTRVVDVINELVEFDVCVEVMDPWCSPDEAKGEYGIDVVSDHKVGYYDAIIICVAHNEFKALGANGIRELGKARHVLYDLKYVLQKDEVDLRL